MKMGVHQSRSAVEKSTIGIFMHTKAACDSNNIARQTLELNEINEHTAREFRIRTSEGTRKQLNKFRSALAIVAIYSELEFPRNVFDVQISSSFLTVKHALSNTERRLF